MEYENAVLEELAEAEPKTAQFAEDLAKAQKQVNDFTLRAPIDGTVAQSGNLFFIGSVVL